VGDPSAFPVVFARMSREAIPHLKQQGGGRIINILASTVYQPIPNLRSRAYPHGRGGVRQKSGR